MSRILEPKQQRLLSDERKLLRSILLRLSEAGTPREQLNTLERSIEQLEHLFLVVVVGEFNSGKSSLINALVGQAILPDGVTPTTRRIHRLQYGQSPSHEIGAGGIELIGAPIDVLKELSIVDTPGTNALEREHEAITTEFVPQADLILFVTSADRPYTESERQFMEGIRSWGKKLIIVINKIDILSSPAEVLEVERFVADSSMRILEQQPHIFAVSARAALAVKGDADEFESDPGFAELESYLYETLDDSEKLRLKLGNPLGVALRLTDSTLAATRSRLDLLASDTSTLVDVEGQLEHYKEDMGREFRFRLSDVDTILHDLERRGVEFFDETLRLPRAIDLMNTAKIQGDFERRVIADAPRKIDGKIQEIIDWMVGSELRQWQSINATLEQRRELHQHRLVGTIGTFDYDRERLLDTVGRAARRSVDAFEEKSQAERMAESVRNAVAGAALIEVGAVSLGTVVTLLATTQFADFTGLLAAGTLAVLGLMVLPARKRRAKRELVAKIRSLRHDLMRSLTEQFDHELERSLLRIGEAIAPYSRFVRAEKVKLEESTEKLESGRREIQGLEARIGQL
ncbi:MAG: dynamin family protein [Acidobacteriota bacterium]